MSNYKNIILILFLSLALIPQISAKGKRKYIKHVEQISVEVAEGMVPLLPYQVYVTYSDGTHEWRQTRWTNSALTTEQQQADSQIHPEGNRYSIEGHIIGDNTTDYGFPISASITVVKGSAKEQCHKQVATPLPLSSVTITGNNRLTNNRDMLISHLLSLDITQQLYNYRDTYGLSTEGYSISDGWDSPTTKLKGHGSGHYMSALALAYASATLPEHKAELLLRMERMVNELRECQERTFVFSDSLGRYLEARDYAPEDALPTLKGSWDAMNEQKKHYKEYGYGYINAIPASHCVLIEKYSPYNNEEGVWAPYYSVHKQLAGLIDIATILKQQEGTDMPATPKGHLSINQISEKAFVIARDMGLWVWNRLHYRTYMLREGNRTERRARHGNRYEMWNMYIAGEVGGMAESLSRLSEMTDNPTDKAHLIEAASYFDSPALFDPVSRNIDEIRTRHANQHIPMFVGALRSYLSNSNPYYYNLAYNFWNMIQGRYAYAMGGVGSGEMWREPYSQILAMNTSTTTDRQRNVYPNPDINETCCAYNLAKLTKDLNCFDPDDARYMDYYERVLYNQIIGSVNPTDYGVCYHYAVGMNARKAFGNETPQSSCCGGTGSENHVKYQEAAYFVNDSTIWVALYLPSEARWASNDVTITQQCKWPAQKSVIKVSKGTFSMKLRVPYWATEGFDIKLNGKSLAKNYQPCSYFEIKKREWSDEDIVEVTMPFTKHINWGPDKMEIAATRKNETQTRFTPQWVGTLMYGPLVMATSDIHSWKEAEFVLPANLNNILPNEVSSNDGYNGNLYSLTLNSTEKDSKEITFLPDYYHTGHATHYLRLNISDGTKNRIAKKRDFAALDAALDIAEKRINEQNAWEALRVKVPEFSPWARHGYERLCSIAENARTFRNEKNKKCSQEQINDFASSLNAIINSMRPGNLAEPEDLVELFAILERKKDEADKSETLLDAIKYAEMVISYVNDGSGTKDLIQKAIERLK